MKNLNIADALKGRNNNFDFIRFVAAFMVIISHSYLLSIGSINSAPLVRITHNQMNFGSLAVDIFFIISGFLIVQSFERTRNIAKYTKARVLRIFPGLFFALLVTVFVIGPITTNLPVMRYFGNPNTYKYLTKVDLVATVHSLPGVFQNNVYHSEINGSLWTLFYEFACYIIVAGLGVLRLLRVSFLVPLFVLDFIARHFFSTYLDHHVFALTALLQYFLAGSVIYVSGNFLLRSRLVAVISGVILMATSYFGGLGLSIPMCLAYVIIYVALSDKIRLHSFSKYGDFSYGMYIFAFPIQQAVTHFFGGRMLPLMNVMISFPIVLTFAFISWHIVEKPSLKLKNKSLLNFVQGIRSSGSN